MKIKIHILDVTLPLRDYIWSAEREIKRIKGPNWLESWVNPVTSSELKAQYIEHQVLKIKDLEAAIKILEDYDSGKLKYEL